jgi:hypothetical protein
LPAHSLAYGINSVLHAVYLSSDLVGFPNLRGLYRLRFDNLTINDYTRKRLDYFSLPLAKQEFTMPTLQIHSLPSELYEYFQTRARLKKSSLEEQIITVLYQFQQQEETPQQRQARILADIYQSRTQLPVSAPDSVELLREDRQR